MARTAPDLLLLGSGATTGSGVRKRGAVLPSDDFFDSPLVQGALKSGRYPALTMLRQRIPSLSSDSLFEIWNNLYIHRGLVRAGVLTEQTEAKRSLAALCLRRTISRAPAGQKRHYAAQWEIRREREAAGLRESDGYYLSELALWDLRVLVREIYGSNGLDNRRAVYSKLWKPLRSRVRCVVNFNYDTTFDRSFRGRAKPRILHPHGSLEWTAVGIWRMQGRENEGWESWKHAQPDPGLDGLGFHRMDGGRWRLVQPLIVPPASFKEEVIGTSHTAGLEGPLLKEWRTLAQVLAAAERWIFIGFSFSSGDEHLIYLLRRLYRGQGVCCSFYNPVEAPGSQEIFARLMEITGYQSRLCCHPIPQGATIDAFTAKKGCPLWSRHAV
jgi:hypothetical protein